jgi:hypothetical protein
MVEGELQGLDVQVSSDVDARVVEQQADARLVRRVGNAAVAVDEGPLAAQLVVVAGHARHQAVGVARHGVDGRLGDEGLQERCERCGGGPGRVEVTVQPVFELLESLFEGVRRRGRRVERELGHAWDVDGEHEVHVVPPDQRGQSAEVQLCQEGIVPRIVGPEELDEIVRIEDVREIAQRIRPVLLLGAAGLDAGLPQAARTRRIRQQQDGQDQEQGAREDGSSSVHDRPLGRREEGQGGPGEIESQGAQASRREHSGRERTLPSSARASANRQVHSDPALLASESRRKRFEAGGLDRWRS